MRTAAVYLPEYGKRFRCIGPRCEDSCCRGWSVPVDAESYAKYRALPAGELRSLLDAAVLPRDRGEEGDFARIRMGANRECPFWTEERLCRIQAECGESSLCRTCALFPRTPERIDGWEGVSLTLACPEAARLVLLDRELLRRPGKRQRAAWDDAGDQRRPLRVYFWAIREAVMELIADRRYPLWQRLFLLGVLCQRLDGIARGRDGRTFPAFLREFAAVVDSGRLREPMDRAPGNAALQLELVLLLVRMGAARAGGQARLAECLADFAAGIGHGPGARPEMLVAAYSEAQSRWYEPFFRLHEHVLENYVANEMFRWAFPLGTALWEGKAEVACFRAYRRLAAQFGVVKGLLVGVSGRRREGFSLEDVVATVQTATRYFEHQGEFLARAEALLAERGLDNAAGLAALVRN